VPAAGGAGTPPPGDPPGGQGASRALLGRGSLYTLTTLAQAATLLLVTPVLTRLTGTAEFGTVSFGLIVTLALGMLVGLGLPGAITRAYLLDDTGSAGARRLVSTAALTAAAGTALAAGTGPLWTPGVTGTRFDAALLAATLAAAPFAVTQACQAWLRAADRAGAFVALGVTTALGGPALGLLALAVQGEGEHGPRDFLLGTLAGHLLAAGAGLAVVRPGRPALPGDGGPAGRAFRVALPTLPHVVAIYLLNVSDRSVVERFGGLDAVGRYQAAYLVGGAGVVLLNAVNNAWAPLVYRQQGERRLAVLTETTRTVLALAGTLTAALAVAAPLLLAVAAPGERYDVPALVPVTAAVAAATLPMALYLANAHLVFADGRTGWLAVSTPASVVVARVLTLGLVAVAGLTGAGIAAAAGYAVLALAMTLVRRVALGVRWRAPLAPGAWVVGLAGAAAGALLPVTGGWLAVRAVVLVLLAGAALVVLRRALRPG